MKVAIKRVYEAPVKEDGVRLLIDRLWPRGIKKENLAMEGWIKDLAPSSKLRAAFHQHALDFKEFEKKYLEELKNNKEKWQPLIEKYKNKKITLLYGAKDPIQNHAIVLRDYLEDLFSIHL